MKKSILINLLIITLIIINILRITIYDYLFFSINTTKVASNINNTTDYIGILEIPSINLKKGIVDFNSIQNNVKYNIKTIKKSDNNLILASHSGNGKNAYFKNLYKVNIDDIIITKYIDYDKVYIVTDKYKVDKIGKVNISHYKDENIITLITCDHIDKTKQIVVIGKLIEKKEI